MTWLVAAIALAEAIGSAIADASLRDVGLRIQVAIGLFVRLDALSGPTVRPLLVPVALVLSLLDGLALPLRFVAIQRLANDGARAGGITRQRCDMALKTIALPLAGLWRGRLRFLR